MGKDWSFSNSTEEVVTRWIQAVKKPEQLLCLFYVTETVINDPPLFFTKEKKRDVQLTDILLIVSANLPCIKGFIGCNASVRKSSFWWNVQDGCFMDEKWRQSVYHHWMFAFQ